MDTALAEAERRSAPPQEDENGPTRQRWRDLSPHFILNLDEANHQANAADKKLVGARSKKKHDRNQTDSRISITGIECGTPAGNDGPSIYLMAGVDMQHHLKPLYGSSKALQKQGAPANSFVLMTPNAFLTNEAWDTAAEPLAKGIRAMPVIRDHPDFWVVLLLDGYAAHVMTFIAQLIFLNYKILVVKETSGTSHVNQAYDQAPAKEV